MDKILSVIVPSYNMEQYLPKCLGSLVVAPELMEKLEILVVNDGSKDRTSEIAHEFAAKYPDTFRVIDKPNGHYGSCINAALPMATGNYVKILDADDWFDNYQFGAFLTFLNDHQDVDVVISDVAIVNAEGTVFHSHVGLATDRKLRLDDLCNSSSWLSMHALSFSRKMLLGMKYRQSEGIPYTDGEWSALPMLSVDTAFYFPNELYMYLKGREGQSVAPAAQIKNFDSMVCVLESVTSKGLVLVEQRSEACKKYLSKWLANYLDMVSPVLLKKIPLWKFNGYWRRMAASFQLVLRSEVQNKFYTYIVSRSVRFRYLQFMLRHMSLALPTICLVRLCWSVRGLGLTHGVLKYLHRSEI